MRAASVWILGVGVLAASDLPQVTDLSRKAANVRSGMTRTQVLNLLGPPTWALLPTDSGDWAEAIDDGFNLMWRNGKCNPVTVTFDNRARVDGRDEGTAVCDEKTWTAVPRPEYACTKKDRVKYCR